MPIDHSYNARLATAARRRRSHPVQGAIRTLSKTPRRRQLPDLSIKRLRAKIPALTQALAGRFTNHHAFLVELHLKLIDQHTMVITTLTQRIEEAMEPFRAARDLVSTIPGIGVLTADVIIAETGGDMPSRSA